MSFDYCLNFTLSFPLKVMLCDFGFATEVQNEEEYATSSEQPSLFCGTVQYAAPEVLKEERYGVEAGKNWFLIVPIHLSKIFDYQKRYVESWGYTLYPSVRGRPL